MVDFRKIAETLVAHPDVWLARAQFLPGASAETIARAESHLQAELNPEVKAFYTHHNGLAIEWMYKKTDRFEGHSYDVDTSEIPFWMDLFEGQDPPYDGRIIVAPIGEVIVDAYENIHEMSDFDTSVPYIEYFRDPPIPNEGPFKLGDREFASEAAFRAQLRIFDNYAVEEGNMVLFEPGKSDPDLLHCEDDWDNFNAKAILPLSKYLHHLAYDFGLRDVRTPYFHGAPPAPIEFDLAARLEQLLAEYRFPGDLR